MCHEQGGIVRAVIQRTWQEPDFMLAEYAHGGGWLESGLKQRSKHGTQIWLRMQVKRQATIDMHMDPQVQTGKFTRSLRYA